jgi:hypothetical protein
MTNPISKYYDARTHARYITLRRVVLSSCVSIALHAGLLALPPGSATWGVSRSAPPPLSITLAPTPLQLANAPPTHHTRPLPEALHFSQIPQPIQEAKADSSSTARSAETAQAETYNDFGMPVPIYHEPHEISQRAEILEEIDLNLPEISAFHGAGQAVMTIYVNETGGVDRIEIEDSNIDSILANALAQQFARGIFQPAKIGGAAVKSRVKIEVLVRP